MADDKPIEVHTCTVDDCVPIGPGDNHWFPPHMPCWICCTDPHDQRGELMWNDFCEVFFHRSCIENRK